MREVMEVKELKELKEVKERSRGVAAFFDLDGTLVALPSLERRFFRTLRYRRAIAVRNCFLWLAEAMRLAPRGIGTILQANKMYLRGVESFDERGSGDDVVSPWHKSGHQAAGQASAPPRRNPRLPVPTFFAEGVEHVAWHAKQGDAIVLVSGTLEPLAQAAARALESKLAGRGIFVSIQVCATRLEETDGRWTGQILGEPMFGAAKTRAVQRIAAGMKLDLTECYAYGDRENDRGLLSAVGRPAAVNPANELVRIAAKRGWPVLRWNENWISTQRTQSSQRRRQETTRSNPREWQRKTQ